MDEIKFIDRKDVPSGNWVALDPLLRIVAFDVGKQRTKEKAIALGVHSPLVIRVERLKKE